MNTTMYDVAVIGAGSAGTMAALRSVLNNDLTLLLSGNKQDKIRSRAKWVSKVENVPAHLSYRRGIEEPNKESLKWLQAGELKDKLTWLENLGVTKLSKSADHFVLIDDEGNNYTARYVILCTGVMDLQPMIQGDISPIFPFANAQLIDYCLRCDGHHTLNKDTAVIGHSESAVWVAVMLKERYNNPSMSVLTNGEKLDIKDDKLQKLVELYDIHIYPEKILEVLGDKAKKELSGFRFESGKSMICQIAFVSLGMMVYNQLARTLGANLDERGFVLTNAKGESSIPGLYVAGDLRANTKKQIYTAWDTAVDSADAINQLLRSERREKLLAQKN